MVNLDRQRVKNAIKDARETLLKTAQRVMGPTAYFLAKGSFREEQRAIHAGAIRHDLESQRKSSQMFMRRSVHRLEKGLVSQNRRATFAADYIEDLVATVKFFASDQKSIDLGEVKWASHVLDEYFDATSTSPNGCIIRARAEWANDKALVATEERLVPFPYQPIPWDENSVIGLESIAMHRRSVRDFTNEEVPRELVERAAAIGLASPSACNRQSFKLILIADRERRQRIARIPMGTVGFADKIPLLGVIVGQHRGYAHERDRHAIHVDGGLFAGPFVLALEAMGLSSCCINWPEIANKNREIAHCLGLDRDERVVMLIAIGFGSAGQLVPRSHKRAVEGVVTWR